MIKVVFVLVVLLLSAIFAYLVLSNKKGEESTKNKTQEGAKTSNETGSPEDEDTSSTANAQPIETEPPEDKGTCETTGDWAMSGECQADGTAIFTQTYKESKPGACSSTEKARVKPCCYQKGDWKDISECDEGGRKTQEQTTINCASDLKTRRVDCEYVGPWVKTGGCTPDGKQYYNRLTINSASEPNKSEKCCYTSNWSNWGGWGGCDGSKRYRTRTRKVVNCPTGTADKETDSQNCRNCKGYWQTGAWSRWSGQCLQTRTRQDTYIITQNASNGGSGCPHRHGQKSGVHRASRRYGCSPPGK
jgi:hypothetical protein